MDEKRQLVIMRALLVAFVVLSAGIALWQYTSPVNFIAQLMGISWGALAGAFLGPFLWGLYSGKISKASVWCSFIVGVGLTTGNMISGFVGTPWIASPINAGALAMILSIVIVPAVSLFTPSVPFEINPPTAKGAGDRAFEEAVEGEEISPTTGGKGIEGATADEIAGVK